MFDGVDASALVKEDRSDWSIERRLSQRIIDGERDGLDADLGEALGAGWAALEVVNGPLLGGMKTSASCSVPGRCSCRSSCSRRKP